MRKKLRLFLLALLGMIGSLPLQAQHTYENGICTDEECTDPYEKPDQEGDWYILKNAGNVEWFSKQIASGELTLKAKLDCDIDFQGIENLHSPIGPNTGRKFNGTFDGQGHRIKNMIINRPEENNQGFFGFLRGNNQDTRVMNLIIDKSCSITGANYVGGITANAQNSETIIYIENCINEAEVIAATGGDAGGIIGSSTTNTPKWNIKNCVNAGHIVGNGYAGALCAWMGNSSSIQVDGFLNIGIVEGFDQTNNITRMTAGSYSRIYDLSMTEGAGQGIIEGLTPEDVTSGKLAYVMNGDQSSIIWRQTLGTDSYPVPFESSLQVYLNGLLRCDGTPLEGGTYSNTETAAVIPPHSYPDGEYHCEECGHINEDFCPNIDGVYQINSARGLEWMAELVASGKNEINAALTADIDLTGSTFPGIGTRTNGYKGSFDGQYHIISGLDLSHVETDWSGFFNFIFGGATIQNLILDETCTICGNMGVGLIGGATLAGNILLKNLGMHGNVTAFGRNAGGILGCNTGSVASIRMENCFATGNVTGTNESGLLSGWMGSNSPVAINCWATGECYGIESEEKYLFRHSNLSMSNCYSVFGTQGKNFTIEELLSGALTYTMNSTLEAPVWFQNLDNDQPTDDYPTFDPSHGIVYVDAKMNCDGTFETEDASYSNQNNAVIPPHQYKDGFCTVCGHEDAEYPFIRIFANADHEITTGYVNNNSNDGSGLAINNSVAEHWNQQWFDTYQELTGLSKGIYKLRVQGLTRVKEWKNEEGEPYEYGMLSDDYKALYYNSQYYAEVGGRRVANRFMDISEGRYEQSTGEIENFNEYTNCYVPNSLAAAHKRFMKGDYWNQPIYFAVESEEDTVKIGVENRMYLHGNWTVWDTWRLEYVGDATEENIQLIRSQQEAAIQDIMELEGQATLTSDYQEAQNAISQASSLEEVLQAADVLSRTPQQIRLSHMAYLKFQQAIESIMAERAAHPDLNGDYTDLLDTYLEGNEAEVEGLPNGTYLYIMGERLLDIDQLEAEAAFAAELLNMAVKTSVMEGSDITNLIVNPAFDADENFQGWTYEITKQGTSGSNFYSNSGFTDIYPVAGTWNTAFNLWQDMEEGLPDGIYELEAPAFYRPGANGQGDLTGNDFVPATLYINDFHTPVTDIYAGRVLYADAINGVNCRYDAVNDETAPHNGEYPSSQDYDTGDGYVPEQRQAMSFAFAAGRYVNHAYAIVEGGKIRLGIQNQAKPWNESGMTMWGKFKLTYRGYNEDALDAIIANLEARKTAFEKVRNDREYYYSLQHITQADALIQQAKACTDLEEKIALVKQANAEVNAIITSEALYSELTQLKDYIYEQATNMIETEPDKAEHFYSAGDEIDAHIFAGDLTDEECKQLYKETLYRTDLNGGFYVQGDLVDSEGNDLTYGARLSNYPLTRQQDGTWTGIVRVQDRSKKPNASARAGMYFTLMNQTYKATNAQTRFVTPAHTTFDLVLNGGQDYQMVGGEFQVTLNPDEATVTIEPITYPWAENVYVVGTVLDNKGELHDWKNDEAVPLPHKGNGVYEGNVTFTRSEGLWDGNACFTIFACRSTESDISFSQMTRSNWTEARYGSAEDQTVLEPGSTLTDLIRGSDRKWMVPLDEAVESVTYTVIFDMNNRTVQLKSIDGDAIEEIAGEETDNKAALKGIYTLTGQRVNKATRGLYIINGKKVLVK